MREGGGQQMESIWLEQQNNNKIHMHFASFVLQFVIFVLMNERGFHGKYFIVVAFTHSVLKRRNEA